MPCESALRRNRFGTWRNGSRGVWLFQLPLLRPSDAPPPPLRLALSGWTTPSAGPRPRPQPNSLSTKPLFRDRFRAVPQIRRKSRDLEVEALGMFIDDHVKLRQVFDEFDTSGDGFLDVSELKFALSKTGRALTLDETRTVMKVRGPPESPRGRPREWRAGVELVRAVPHTFGHRDPLAAVEPPRAPSAQEMDLNSDFKISWDEFKSFIDKYDDSTKK